MAIFKLDNCHGTLREAQRRMEALDRDSCIEMEFFNLMWGCEDRWAETMDETRRFYGNDRPGPSGPAITYRVASLMPNPKDEIDLATIKELTARFVDLEFGDEGCYEPKPAGKIGTFEVCAVYGRLPSTGTLYARLLINNTNLQNGRRFRITRGEYRAMGDDLQTICMDMGLHYFTHETVDGVSVSVSKVENAGR